MLDQASFNLITILIALGSGMMAVLSLVWQIYRSRKDDQHQNKQAATQDRQAEALESQAEALLRQANIWEESLLKEAPRVDGETAEQRWTRAFVLGQLASATIKLKDDVHGDLAPVITALSELKTRVDQIVTVRDYMEHEGILFTTLREAGEIRDEICEYHRRGLNTDEIKRQILRHIGDELLRMAEAPAAFSSPAPADEGQAAQDREGPTASWEDHSEPSA
jgi:Tfp pilus assembly protein PilV